MERTLRIGLIGCGGQGRRLGQALKGVEVAQLVACADPRDATALGAVEALGFARAHRDYEEMLAGEDLDAVVVATPHSILRDAAVASVRAGCHVFIEKPMALDRAQAREIRTAAIEAGVTVMAGYCQRFAEGRRIMKSLIERGAVGELRQVSAGKGSGPLRRWLADPEKGGGQLLYLGVHITDQILWMVGSEAEAVQAEINRDPGTGVDQDSAFTIRFGNGVLASVLCSQNVGVGFDFVEVLGSAGRIRSEWKAGVVEIQSQVIPEYSRPTTIRHAAGPMFTDEMEAWTSSLVEGREPPITVDDGIRVLAIIDSAVESARTGLPVDPRS